MSSTGTVVIHGARILMGDVNDADPIVTDDAMRLSVNTQVSLMADDLGMGPKWLRNAISLDTSNHDYIISTTVEHSRILQVAYSTDYYPLTKIPASDLIKMRAGYKGNGGRQFVYALDVNESQQTVLMLVYKPSVAEDIDLYLSQLPDHWDDGPGTAPTIPWPEKVIRALELRVAADVVGTLGPDRMIALALNPNVPDKWNKTADQLVRGERIRLNGLKRMKMVSRVAAWS